MLLNHIDLDPRALLTAIIIGIRRNVKIVFIVIGKFCQESCRKILAEDMRGGITVLFAFLSLSMFVFS